MSIGCLVLLLLASSGMGQRVAVLAPDDTEGSRAYVSKLERSLEAKLRVIDDSLANSAFSAVASGAPYNLSLDEAKRAGQAIGCDFFVLVHSGVRRQSSFQRNEYYDAYAAVFLISARSGRLVDFYLTSELSDKPDAASAKLDSTISSMTASLIDKLASAAKSELDEKPPPQMEEPPEEGSPAAKNFRAPVPFRRLKPEYTKLADQYEITATVDVIVDLDADGHVLRTEITRWAGYDLDRSVDKAVRSMNWRAAEREGKFIPMRFLVRYNFKKADKPPQP